MFIPLKSEASTRHFPLAVIFLIALNIYIFFHLYSQELSIALKLIQRYGATPYEIWHNVDKEPHISHHVYLTFVSSLFLHGGFFHLLSNMLYLWIFGTGVEDRIGHFRFIFFYLICGVAASFVHVIFNHESLIPTIGASGAISGVLGSYLIIFPKAKIRTFILFRIFRVPAFIFLSLWIILQFSNVIFKSVAEGNIAWWAHIGGFIAGFIFIRLYKIDKKVKK